MTDDEDKEVRSASFVHSEDEHTGKKEEVSTERKKRKTLFPLPIVFGVSIATLLIMLAVLAGRTGLEKQLKTAVVSTDPTSWPDCGPNKDNVNSGDVKVTVSRTGEVNNADELQNFGLIAMDAARMKAEEKLIKCAGAAKRAKSELECGEGCSKDGDSTCSFLGPDGENVVGKTMKCNLGADGLFLPSSLPGLVTVNAWAECNADCYCTQNCEAAVPPICPEETNRWKSDKKHGTGTATGKGARTLAIAAAKKQAAYKLKPPSCGTCFESYGESNDEGNGKVKCDEGCREMEKAPPETNPSCTLVDPANWPKYTNEVVTKTWSAGEPNATPTPKAGYWLWRAEIDAYTACERKLFCEPDRPSSPEAKYLLRVRGVGHPTAPDKKIGNIKGMVDGDKIIDCDYRVDGDTPGLDCWERLKAGEDVFLDASTDGGTGWVPERYWEDTNDPLLGGRVFCTEEAPSVGFKMPRRNLSCSFHWKEMETPSPSPTS